jgi:hypothetical protein
MKIELEVENLKTLIDALNNAIISYNDIRTAVLLGCHVDIKWEPLIGNNFNTLTSKFDERLTILHDIYKQLVVKESEGL